MKVPVARTECQNTRSSIASRKLDHPTNFQGPTIVVGPTSLNAMRASWTSG